jgi:ABC-2 type transport system ATP-binding protein
VQDKASLMAQMGKKQLQVELAAPLTAVPEALAHYALEIGAEGRSLIYTFDTKGERTGITTLLSDLRAAGLQMTDLATRQSSLEDIFVGLVRERA